MLARSGRSIFTLPVLALTLASTLAMGEAWGQSDEAVDIYAVRGVGVDVTAETAVEAKAAAFVEGRAAALAKLLRRLTLSAHRSRLPVPEAARWDSLIETYQVEEEKLSATRYIASLRFQFVREGVHALLRSADIPFSESRSKPVLVLPVLGPPSAARLFDSDNAWLAAWRLREDDGGGLVPLRVAQGDALDRETIDAYGALEGSGPALTALAQRYGAERVVVAYAAAGSTLGLSDRPRLLLSAKVYGRAHSGDLVEKFEAGEGEDQAALFARAIERLALWLADDWKRETLLDFADVAVLEASAALASFRDWLALRQAMNEVASITGWDIRAISTLRVDLTIRHRGDARQLTTLLAQRDIELFEDARGWRLRLAPGARRGSQRGALRPKAR